MGCQRTGPPQPLVAIQAGNSAAREPKPHAVAAEMIVAHTSVGKRANQGDPMGQPETGAASDSGSPARDETGRVREDAREGGGRAEGDVGSMTVPCGSMSLRCIVHRASPRCRLVCVRSGSVDNLACLTQAHAPGEQCQRDSTDVLTDGHNLGKPQMFEAFWDEADWSWTRTSLRQMRRALCKVQ